MTRKLIDLTGRESGHLTVIRVHERKRYPNGQVVVYWWCRCVCGAECAVAGGNFRTGKSTSCGCKKGENVSRNRTRHGGCRRGKKLPEFTIWVNMINRCNNPKDKRYGDYGGRGIKVCERWGDFGTFLKDMGSRPSPLHHIDRCDNDAGYSPENCRWVTRERSARNKRGTVYLTYKGRTLPLPDWAELCGVSQKLLRQRKNRGWSDERVLQDVGLKIESLL